MMLNESSSINHKEWLKDYWGRESTYSTYPKDCALPICALAQYGFYFDSLRKSFKCSECTFEYANIFTESLDELLSQHYKHSNHCSKAVYSLDYSLDLSLNKLDVVEWEKEGLKEFRSNKFDINSEVAEVTIVNRKQKNLLINEESRLKSFENVRLIINTQQLVSNGFYRVDSKELSTLSATNKSSSFDSFNLNQIMKVENGDLSQIAKIAASLASLIHIKCVFCSYECLLFKNSHLNTRFKSPFDEHKEKSSKVCPVFNTDLMNAFDLTSKTNILTDFKLSLNKYQDNLKWLQCLYDFEFTSTIA